MTQNGDHNHDRNDGYPGSRYQTIVHLDNGTILTSTPIPLKQARELGDLLTKVLASAVRVGSTSMTVESAQYLLIDHANMWEADAVQAEDLLAPKHSGFLERAQEAWGHAARLKKEAKELSEIDTSDDE